jgi:hypothetical protein
LIRSIVSAAGDEKRVEPARRLASIMPGQVDHRSGECFDLISAFFVTARPANGKPFSWFGRRRFAAAGMVAAGMNAGTLGQILVLADLPNVQRFPTGIAVGCRLFEALARRCDNHVCTLAFSYRSNKSPQHSYSVKRIKQNRPMWFQALRSTYVLCGE